MFQRLTEPSLTTPLQIRTLFSYFNLYRILIGLLLFGMTFARSGESLDFRHPDTYQFTTLAYLILNVCVYAYYRIDQALSHRQLFFSLCLDISLLHALFFLGQGVDGGLSNLVIISVAAANIVIRGRLGMAIAALASILSLGIEINRNLLDLSDVGDIARAGLLGSIYFAAAYMVQNLSQRISQGEDLAQQQQQELVELQELNQQVIQSMRTGIIVCDAQYRIKTMNHACQDLLGLKPGNPLPQQLKDRIKLWKHTPSSRTTPFRSHADFPMVQANFSLLHQETGDQTLIFIEDTRLMTQQAQQLKLASLGRLTASIAHEIRNPLGAISHATQLLRESDTLDAPDLKMTEIILRHCGRVNKIVENTLSLSRQTESSTQELMVSEWLTRVVSDFREQNGCPDISLDIVTPEACARFDPNQIEQVLVNLLDNAARHGQQFEAGSVLKVSLAQTNLSEQAYIDVINAGELISEEVKQHLFEPFFTTESSGTGLGLYLSKEICEANQAQLDYIESDQIENNETDNHVDKQTEDKASSLGVCFRILFAPPKRLV